VTNGLLVDKVAVVTGGGGGIGRAIALRLSSEGAKVVLNDNDTDRLGAAVRDIEAAGGEALPVLGDITSPDIVDDLARVALGVAD
jgi:3-oxoacyl-[acyl-carrier protein] reductase